MYEYVDIQHKLPILMMFTLSGTFNSFDCTVRITIGIFQLYFGAAITETIEAKHVWS